MWNVLPSIHIRTSNAAAFCNSIIAIAEASGSFTITRDPDVPSIIGLKFVGQSPHKELSAQLINAASDNNAVAIEIRAETWQPDPPTYDAYRAAAELLIKPLLSTYNRNKQTRYSMSITSKRARQPGLPPQSYAWFKRFTTHANKATLHSNDWRRFYDFVRCSRANRIELAEQDMARILLAEGFSEERSTEIARSYRLICDYERPRNAAETLDYLHFKHRLRSEKCQLLQND